MARGGFSNILGRGAFLVGIIDVCISLCWIVSCTNIIIETEMLKGYQLGQNSSAVSDRSTIFIIMLVIHSIILVFGIMLLIGVYLAKSWLVLTWYIPNLVVIFIAFLACLILAFTQYAYFAMTLPGLICFRAFETWIVGEFHWNLGY